MAEPFDAKAVQAHYRAQAARYTQGANKACAAVYQAWVRSHLGNAQRIVEIGCGTMPVSMTVQRAQWAGCDLSVPMLREARLMGFPCCAADGGALPFSDDTFDGAVSINVLEHTPDPGGLLQEAARVLRPGGALVAITPNGRHRVLLDWLERARLKLPEGPHRFLGAAELRNACEGIFRECRVDAILAVPAGPVRWVEAVDRIAPYGLFLALVARK